MMTSIDMMFSLICCFSKLKTLFLPFLTEFARINLNNYLGVHPNKDNMWMKQSNSMTFSNILRKYPIAKHRWFANKFNARHHQINKVAFAVQYVLSFDFSLFSTGEMFFIMPSKTIRWKKQFNSVQVKSTCKITPAKNTARWSDNSSILQWSCSSYSLNQSEQFFFASFQFFSIAVTFY